MSFSNSTNLWPTEPFPTLPQYHLTPRHSLLPWISDFHLSLLLPVLAYWLLSAIYHIIFTFDLFSQYRIHTPAEYKTRNRATVSDVLSSVILQQILQTAWGLFLGHIIFGIQEMTGKEEYDIAIWTMRIQRIAYGSRLILQGAGVVLGINTSGWEDVTYVPFPCYGVNKSLAEWELLAGRTIYWILVPTLQFSIAVFLSDTWQYFWHRAMHANRWLYQNMHAQHHRIYVPYAFGAFYNTLSEAFILDTIGTTLSLYLAGLSTRQATIFGTISVLKGVDDHCGYKLPWDPLQWLGEQTVEFHDVHHQSWGIRTNYSQLYTTFWDHVCGTVCAKSEAEKQLLYLRARTDSERAFSEETDEKKQA